MKELEAELQTIKSQGLYRSLKTSSGRCVCSNDYLGLARDERIRAAIVDALESGVPHGSTGSRLLAGHHAEFDALERAFAQWQGSEAALFFGSGYAANLGLLTALLDSDSLVLSDELNHASLIDGLRLTKAPRKVIPHLDLSAYERALSEGRRGQSYVVVESLYGMDGDIAPLRELADLCRKYKARLIVDEAHATGLFGRAGAGLVSQLGVRDAVFASVHTCGKALGHMGAFICGSADLKSFLINRSRSFIFSTALPPFMAVGLLKAIEIIASDEELRSRPAKLGARLRKRLEGRVDTGMSASQIVPLIVGEGALALSLAKQLAQRGWDARAIRPPTVPEGTCRIRLALHNGISDEELEQLGSDILIALELQEGREDEFIT